MMESLQRMIGATARAETFLLAETKLTNYCLTLQTFRESCKMILFPQAFLDAVLMDISSVIALALMIWIILLCYVL